MNELMRKKFEEITVPAFHNFPPYDIQDIDVMEGHWKTFQEGWEAAVKECIAICEQNAGYGDEIAKSESVTDNGRMLHEGMWAGATNCATDIRVKLG
jgi:hypothetical protein